jgi:tetratricopeptide (TPR) repeat protein
LDRYFELGQYSHPVTTASAEAQGWFDRGLVWVYGFNMEEAERCFERAAAADPACAMAHWGIAYARGPFYNKPWEYFGSDEAREALAVCHRAVCKARDLASGAPPLEQALIEAACRRFPSSANDDPALFAAWEDDFAVAMRDVHRRYPDDLDVASVFALALMTRTPWRLWDIRTGRPTPGASSQEARRVLEASLARARRQGVWPHPGLAHMYIHVMEMSPTPEKALAAADSLRDYSKDCGHLHHMPGHIYVQCGLYHEAVVASEKATQADRRYAPHANSRAYYTMDRCHHLHLMVFAAAMLGQLRPSLEACDRIDAILDPQTMRFENPYLARMIESYRLARLHVLVRFGQWREIVALPAPGDAALYPLTTVLSHYAKGIAHGALGSIAEADRERTLFREARGRVPADRIIHNNPADGVLAVAEAMLEGEVTYRKGHHGEAFAHLRRAIDLDDNLAYSEPWPWMHPPRHALGALLLEQDHVAEAAAVYRADLGIDNTVPRPKQNPGNVWALHGLSECLERLGQTMEAGLLAKELAVALARADVEIKASCCCRLGTSGA